MKFGIIKERKNPPDRRVVFSPDELARLKQQYQGFTVKVESSDVRVFTDEDYRNLGIEVADDISDCTIFFWRQGGSNRLFNCRQILFLFFAHA